MIKELFAIIQQINKERGTTILLVEQNASKALQVAHRGYVLANGEIIFNDSGQEFMADEKVKKAYLSM